MSTRAVDIDAPASAVWPWLAQIVTFDAACVTGPSLRPARSRRR